MRASSPLCLAGCVVFLVIACGDDSDPDGSLDDSGSINDASDAPDANEDDRDGGTRMDASEVRDGAAPDADSLVMIGRASRAR